LTETGGEGYWNQRGMARGYKSSIYQQIAVALYVLGGEGGTGERTRIVLNISYASVRAYTQLTINLLAKLLPEQMQWPRIDQHIQHHPIF